MRHRRGRAQVARLLAIPITSEAAREIARRGRGTPRIANRLLRRVRGLELVPLERSDECCGFGGSFSVRFPGISGAMVRDKAAFVEKTRADVLIAAVGVPRMLGAGHVKPGAAVIDVGMNRLEDGLAGDIDFDAAGNLYGTTTKGGKFGGGVAFELSP